MQVQVSKEAICVNKLVTTKKETISVNNDIIVPDTKPDILNAINVSGNICIYKKEIMEGKVKIDGNIDTYIMYLPDSKEDNLRGLNCNLDFNQNIAIPELAEEMQLSILPEIKEMKCKVINGRKITVNAKIEFTIKVYSNEDIEIINEVNNIENIQTLKQNFNINCLIGSGKTTVYAKDTINIDPQEEIAEILKTDINLINKDTKLSYNKVLAKIEVEIKIMYLTENNKIGKCQAIIPTVGFIDIQNISEENICDMNYEIKNIQIKLSSENNIYVELEIEESCTAMLKKEISLIQDLYSPTQNLEFSEKQILLSTEKKEISKEFSVSSKIQDLKIKEEDLIDIAINTSILETKIFTSKITYSGEINLNFIFKKENLIEAKNSKIPFEVSIENPEKEEKIEQEAKLILINYICDVKEETECEVNLKLIVKVSKKNNINIINNIEIAKTKENEDDYDSLILYIVQPGDSLWKIAKKFNTTVEELVNMNDIQDQNSINIGQKIYIPKFKYIKKEKDINETEPVFL